MSVLDISDRTASSALKAAREGHDPLGIASRPDAEARAAILEALEGVDRDTAAAIARAMPEAHRAKDAAVDWTTQTPIDTLTAELMAEAGIDPVVAVWLAIHDGAYSIGDADTGRVLAHVDGVRSDHAMNGSSYAIGDGVEWRTFGEVRTRAVIPETVSIAATGRLLRDIVAHPLLDRRLLRVIHVGRDGAWTTISTDHEAEPATLDELIARSPCGCR